MKISVIIPTLNEAECLAATLAFPDFHSDGVELLVVDGGSRDETVEIARKYGAKVVVSNHGRGRQLQRGALQAAGDVLLFLHADTRLRPGALEALALSLRQPEIVGGNFRLLFDGGQEFDAWLIGFYARIRKRGFYYGDSAIFVRRAVYQRIGGIHPIDLMEDFNFVRRLERAGRTVCIDDPPAVTSSRRFKGRSPRRIVAQWIFIHLLYYIGVSPRILALLYRSTAH